MPNNVGLRATRRRGGRINGGGGLFLAGLVYNYQEVTATGSFALTDVVPFSALYWRVRAYGAGGGGGTGWDAMSVGGGDGGSGGLADTGLVTNDGAAKTISGSVGAGGTGSAGSAGSGTIAAGGGATTASVDTFSLTANGGARGKNYSETSGQGGAGGTGSGGAINVTGGTGASSTTGLLFGGGGNGGQGYLGRGIPATPEASRLEAGKNGKAGGVLIEWWTPT